MKTRILAAVLALAFPAAWARAQEPVATVNGQPIEKAALVEALIENSTLGLQMLDQLVREALLEQEAKKKGATATDQEVQARVDQMRKGRTEDDFKRYMAENQLREKGIVRAVRTKILAEKLFAAQVKVADQEVQGFYDSHKNLFTVPAMAGIRVMLLAAEDEAKAVLDRIAKGESFEAVAKEKSKHIPTRALGGLINPAPKEVLDQLFPGAGDVALSTEVGAVSQPVQKPDGWWLVKVEAKTAGSTRAFDQAKEDIRRDMTDARLNEAYRAWLLQVLQDPTTKIERKL